MRKKSVVLALALSGAFLALAGAQEVAKNIDPPAVENNIDPRALEIFEEMSGYLTSLESFAFNVEEIYDEVTEEGQRIQLDNFRRIAVRRPDRIVSDVVGDIADRIFWYDGSKVTLLDKRHNVYGTLDAPDSIDGTLDYLAEEFGVVLPVSDILYSDLEPQLENVLRGTYLGLHHVAGKPCQHLLFEQENIDWQLWVDAGDQPILRRMTITYKLEEGQPQYTASIRRFLSNPTLNDKLFQFEPPSGATKMKLEGIKLATPEHTKKVEEQ